MFDSIKSKFQILLVFFCFSIAFTQDYYTVDIPETGVTSLHMFFDSITGLEIGDEIGLFDLAAITNYNDCTNQIGELLVAAGVWDGNQNNIVSTGSADACAFGGVQISGYVAGNPVVARVYRPSTGFEYATELIFGLGTGVFGDVIQSVTEVTLGDIYIPCGDDGDVGDEPNSLWLSQNCDDSSWDVGFNSDNDIGGFQISVEGATVVSASGGAATTAGFMISANASMFLGFSLTGETIPAQDGGILVNLTLDGYPSALVDIVISNALGEDLPFVFDDGAPPPIPGCTDETACNYNMDANEDDDSCEYSADYYDCDENCINDSDTDGVCDELEVAGCMDEAACNYDSTATDDNGSCELPADYYDCNGICVNDSDADGVCDELEVAGCMDEAACNYDSTATDDNGSCAYGYDCLGECGGSAYEDFCGVCDADNSNDCGYSIALDQGANLISFYALPDNISLSNIFGDIESSIDGLLAEGSASNNIGDNTWVGSLGEVNLESGYWAIMDASDILEVGVEVDAIDPIYYTLHYGANLISYPFSESTSLSDAISEEHLNDIVAIIGEGESALNEDGSLVGSLTQLNPTSGYWIITYSDEFSFNYSDLSEGMARLIKNEKSQIPMEVSFNQSTDQAFYFIRNIDGANIGDWIVAFNDNTIVGSRQWNGLMIDVPAMGFSELLNDKTLGYCTSDMKVNFKLYKPSSNEWINLASSDDIVKWQNYGISVIDNMSTLVIPTSLSLAKVFPNPFNPVTNITYEVPQAEIVEIDIYNINGFLVETLYNGFHNQGTYNIKWDASYYSSGIYFININSQSGSNTKKIILMK